MTPEQGAAAPSQSDTPWTAAQTLEAMFDADVRVESMIYLPGLAPCGEGSFPEALTDGLIFDCDSLPDDSQLRAAAPWLANLLDRDEDESEIAEAICEHVNLRRVGGFLVQAATPVRERFGEGRSFVSGWGHYHTAWLYCATEADIGREAVKWAEARHDEDIPALARGGSQ